jgi:DNA-binding response OmpR family regulator
MAKTGKYGLILIEDDLSLGYLLSEYLGMKGFDITWKKTAREGLVAIESNLYDLAILDVMMPDMDGFALAAKIHNLSPRLPFMFLTARSLKIDVLKGFSIGAVDYIKKPIDEEELVARIEALLSRLVKPKENGDQDRNHILGSYVLDSVHQELIHPEGNVTLTGRECELLLYLALHKNELCSHKDILVTIWGKNDYFNRKSLNVFISHLRKYLRHDPSIRLENLHGQGFILKMKTADS